MSTAYRYSLYSPFTKGSAMSNNEIVITDDEERRAKRNIRLHQPRPGGRCADVKCEGVIKVYNHGCQCSLRCGRLHFYAPK